MLSSSSSRAWGLTDYLDQHGEPPFQVAAFSLMISGNFCYGQLSDGYISIWSSWGDSKLCVIIALIPKTERLMFRAGDQVQNSVHGLSIVDLMDREAILVWIEAHFPK